MYITIMNIEMMVWMRYKIDPFTMFKNVSLNDMLVYTQTLTNRLEEEQKNKPQDKLMTSLVAIRDILNYMTFSKTSNN